MCRPFRVRMCPAINVHRYIETTLPRYIMPQSHRDLRPHLSRASRTTSISYHDNMRTLHVKHVAAIDQVDLNNGTINTFAPHQRCVSAMSLPLASTDVAKGYFAFELTPHTRLTPQATGARDCARVSARYSKATIPTIIAACGMAQANVPRVSIPCSYAQHMNSVSLPSPVCLVGMCRAVWLHQHHTCHEAIR
jgi:hypothetical protein